MSIVYATDKHSEITYAYEFSPIGTKKMLRCRRTLIGRVDPQTGEIRPTDRRCRKNSPYYKDEETEEE